VRTLQRGKEGDPGRLPAVLRAMKELREAHRFFSYLHSMGKVRWGSMGALWVHLDGIRLASGPQLPTMPGGAAPHGNLNDWFSPAPSPTPASSCRPPA